MIKIQKENGATIVTLADGEGDRLLPASIYADFDDFNDLIGVEILHFRDQLPGVVAPSLREDRLAASFDPEVDAWSVGRIGGGVAYTESRTAQVAVARDGSLIAVRVNGS